MENLLKATTIVLLLLAFECRAQVTVYTDITGRPFNTKSYDGIEGSAYLYDDWMSATVKMGNGAVYKNVYLKYNERESKPYFKSKNDEILEFVDLVAEFTITDKAQRFIANNGTYYEVLADGNAKLLKQPIKDITQDQAYVGAGITKTFVQADKYFVMTGDQIAPLKRDKKSVLAALANKQAQVEAYIKKEDPNLKSDAELANLFIYYNSL